MHGRAKRFLNGRVRKSIERHGQGWFHFKRAFLAWASKGGFLVNERSTSCAGAAEFLLRKAKKNQEAKKTKNSQEKATGSIPLVPLPSLCSLRKTKKSQERQRGQYRWFLFPSWLFFLVLLLCCAWQFFLVPFVFWWPPSSSINYVMCSFWSARAGGSSSSSFGSPKTQLGQYRWFSNPPSLRLL